MKKDLKDKDKSKQILLQKTTRQGASKILKREKK
jgi:hypothetical protein